MTAALEGGEWSAARPGRTLPPGKTRYPFYKRLGGSQGRSGRVENLFPTGIRSLTVQPIVSRYTDWATRPHAWYWHYMYLPSNFVIKAVATVISPVTHLTISCSMSINCEFGCSRNGRKRNVSNISLFMWHSIPDMQNLNYFMCIYPLNNRVGI